MQEEHLTIPSQAPSEAAPPTGYDVLVEVRPQGLLRRFLTTWRHFGGLFFGGLDSWVRTRQPEQRHGLRYRPVQLVAALGRPFVDRRLRQLPFPVHLRKRLEILGPTYIKLGQILSLREDILPLEITRELKNLLDRLPALPYERYLARLETELPRPLAEVFARVDPEPLGSASIGQIHRADLVTGEAVIVKLVKPGIRETLRRDVVLLRLLGLCLQTFLARLQPRRLIREFCDYTVREVDLRLEADNAEVFAANFEDEPDIVFPHIYREYTTRNLIVMEFFDGLKPSDPRVRERYSEEDLDRVIDLGAAAIIRMLYRDGFFHADLHPGNLVIMHGPRAGFIDLGMVGRFDEELRRTLLYYYYCLVMGDAENAARYLAAIAQPGPRADVRAFRRNVEDVCRRWQRSAKFSEFSIGRLILESVSRGVVHRMYFPVEMVLMVKAIVTFEGVGNYLKPGFDVAAVSRSHINRLFLSQFSPLRVAREGLRGAPELVDALVKAPMLVTEGLRVLEATTRRPPQNPFTGIRGTIFA
ncbi:MAG: ABC1 kinase family protein, partial [Thermoanaerobaculia bacterium]